MEMPRSSVEEQSHQVPLPSISLYKQRKIQSPGKRFLLKIVTLNPNLNLNNN